MKRKICAFLLFLMPGVSAYAQTYSATSRPKAYHIAKEVIPPILDIEENSIRFIDATGNNAIDANERCRLIFSIVNSGKGDAYGCSANISAANKVQGISVSSQALSPIKAGERRTIEIPIVAGMNTENGSVTFAVQISEPHGFGTDPQYITVNTRAFDAPLLRITDYTVTSENASTLQRKKPFDFQVLLQNVEYGAAENVKVSLSLPDGVLLLGGTPVEYFDLIDGGETRSLVYSLIANNDYNAPTIPIKLELSEKYGKYAENWSVNLAINQTISNNKIVIDEVAKQRQSIEIASIGSDVDRNIPSNKANNLNTFVIIVANENYRREAGVSYALNDGLVFSKYCEQTLGIPSKNIHYYPDATLNDMRAGINWLERVAEAYSNQANIIFYYAGHGVPDEHNANAYLLPVDGYGADIQTGYKLSDLYSKLSSMPAKSIVVFMDACFSGSQRSGQMLASARGVAIKAREEIPNGNMVVFSAAQGDETAYPYNEQSHGMFTYFLLRKLQESGGDATLGELADYVKDQVSKRSVIERMKSQTPTVIPSAGMSKWRSLKLR